MTLQSALVIFGLPASIPVILGVGAVALKSMERLPIVIPLGAALMGYPACGTVFDDIAFVSWVQSNLPLRGLIAPALDMRPDMPSLIAAGMIVLPGARTARSRFEITTRSAVRR